MPLDNKIISKRYGQLIFICFFAYMISYVGRLGYNTNIQNFIDGYGITKLQAGYASSAFFFCYGAGQFINGILCEKMNSSKVISFSLLVSSLISLSLFFIKNIIVISVLWGLNGFVLSTLWCNLVKITAKIKDEKYLKQSVVVLSVSLPVGTVFAYGCSSLLTFFNIWQGYFIISAVILGVGALVFFAFINRIESDISKIECTLDSATKQETQTTDKKSLLKFLKFAIIPVFFISVFGSLIKDGVQTWMPTFLKENYDMPTSFSILVTLILPLFGIFAAMLAKFIMDKINNIFISVALVFVVAVLFLLAFVAFGNLSVIIPIVIFAFLTLITHAANTLFTSIFPIYYNNHIKSGQTAGIFNCFAYVGSALSSFAFGGIVDSFGWNVFSLTLLGCAALALVLAFVGYFLMRKKDAV